MPEHKQLTSDEWNMVLRPFYANEVIKNMDSIREMFGESYAAIIENRAKSTISFSEAASEEIVQMKNELMQRL